MAETNIGKITQVISAVLDIKFPQGGLPEINDAIEIRHTYPFDRHPDV